ncbi:MAG: glycosyltransferase family 2 protein [Candidatus Paceibacterota bacterium]
MEKIPCTIGILTYNSEQTLARCLESVKEFSDIVVADGGSSDGTLAIARAYGARVLTQSNPGHPISNFSRERNILLDSAHEDWFFYIDSDEVATPELVQETRTAVTQQHCDAYRVRYALVHPETLREYYQLKPVYQVRLCNIKKTGARFIKPMHEKLSFEVPKDRVGIIHAPWLVPLDSQLSWHVYKGKVQARFPILARKWSSRNPFLFFYRVIVGNVVRIVKGILKPLLARIFHPFAFHVPLKYELFRLYVPCVLIWHTSKRYGRLLIDGE